MHDESPSHRSECLPRSTPYADRPWPLFNVFLVGVYLDVILQIWPINVLVIAVAVVLGVRYLRAANKANAADTNRCRTGVT